MIDGLELLTFDRRGSCLVEIKKQQFSESIADPEDRNTV